MSLKFCKRIMCESVKHSTRLFELLLIIVVPVFLVGCENTTSRQDEWPGFMRSVLEAGKSNDPDQLVRKLTLYKITDVERFGEKMAAATPGAAHSGGDSNLSEKEAYSVMLEDAKVFLRSYDQLFDGKPARWSLEGYQEIIKGVDIYSVILWVMKGGKYKGIYIHRVWKDGRVFRVIEWVPDPSDGGTMSGALWSNRAILEADTAEQCVFPKWMNYEAKYRK